MKLFVRITVFVMGILIGASVILVPYLIQATSLRHKDEVKINDQFITVDVVKDPADRDKGLSGRSELGINEGMLFIFDTADLYGFWMKGMQFPIDIVWIKNNAVVGFVANVDPQIGASLPSLRVYYPPEPVDRVLELKAGRTALLRLQVGDAVHARPLVSQ